MGGVGLFQPADLVYLLLNLQRLEVIKFRLVTLEGAVHIVLPTARRARLLALKFGKRGAINILVFLRFVIIEGPLQATRWRD